ncbi:hypothetical protein OROGR_003231 [Orobanche gracilis]
MGRYPKPENPTEPKFFTTPKINPPPKSNWRIQIKQTQLVSQASSVLLQMHSKCWGPHLKPLKFSSIFSPSIFHQILNRTQTHPRICFSFFRWAQKTLDFKPDPVAQCRMIRILFGSGLSELGRPILNSVVQNHPPAKIVPFLISSKESADLHTISQVLNSVIDCYCRKQMYSQSLEVYRMGRQYGFELRVDTCNALLSLLSEKNELRLAWCCYGSCIRYGFFLGDEFTWSVIARVLYKDGKFEKIPRILDMGIYNFEMFDLLIDGYSERGDFESAFDYLNELGSRGIEPSFSTYSSILDGACKHGNTEVIGDVMSFVVEKGRDVSASPGSDYNSIIQKLYDVNKTYAMDLFFKMARDGSFQIQHSTYECMLRALLPKKNRVRDAIELYNAMQEKNIRMSESCRKELVIGICKENIPSQKFSNLLAEVVRGGFDSASDELSTYVGKQCAQGRWREAEELFDSIMDEGCLLDPISCGSFVKYYCFSGKIDKAILLHDKLEGLNGALDVAAYNAFVAALFKEKRIEETMKVFDCMRRFKRLNSESFSLMISGLCHEKEMRKAMKLHDEMLELGLKPDQRTYKRLISGFG